MKRRGRLAAVMMMLVLMLQMMTGCGPEKLSDNIRIGTLAGPTGMGLVELIDNESVDVEIYQSPTDVVQKLLSGDIDVACVPSNLGAVLYAKTGGEVQILTTVVNGVLYIVENGDTISRAEDLKGKTIYGSGRGGTPEYVLKAIVESAGLEMDKDVHVQWMENHADAAQKAAAEPGAAALLPEPQVTSLMAGNEKIKVALDMNDLWKDMTGQELPMGILVAKKDFTGSRGSDTDVLLELVADSVADVTEASDEVIRKIVDAGIVPSFDVCKAVIPNCSLTCMSAEDSRAALSAFFEKLYGIDKASVGGDLPGNDIYYGAEK